MMNLRRVAFMVAVCALLTGCGGGSIAPQAPAGGGSIAPQSPASGIGTSVETISDAELPQGFANAAAITGATRVAFAAPAAAVRRPAMGFGPEFNDADGWKTSAAGGYTGVFGFHAAYAGVDLNALGEIGFGPPSMHIEGPVTRAPGGSCYEVATYYVSSLSGVFADFVVADLCAGGVTNPYYFVVQDLIDATFTQKYIRQTATLPPSYAFAIVTFDRTPSASSTWYVALYDYVSHAFDLVASRTGLYSDPRGLSEYRYGVGEDTDGSAACNSGDPPIGAEQLTFFRPTLFGFDPVRPHMSGLTIVPDTPASNGCFGEGAYAYDVLVPDSSWQVRDLHGI